MILNVLAAASMLLWMNISPVQSTTTHVSVEPITIEAPVQDLSQMSSETLSILLEEYATPHWGFSGTEAWTAYHLGTLKIIEITPDEHYSITYADGILDVVFEGAQG